MHHPLTILAPLAAVLLLSACASPTPQPAIVLAQPEPADTPAEIQTETVREIVRPCSARLPKRPDPLPADLPRHPVALAALLGAKLAEYSAPGKYADQAEAYFRACPPSR